MVPARQHTLTCIWRVSGSQRRSLASVVWHNPTRKRSHPLNHRAYQQRSPIELTRRRLKDCRRIATRYDQLAANFASAVTIAAIIVWWTW